MASHHKSTTLRFSAIIDPHFYKSRRKPPWRVTTSPRLGQIIGSPIQISISQGDILLGQSPQVNDLDG